MIRAFLKRFIIWLILSMPIAIGVSVLASLYLGTLGQMDKFTAAGNGVLTGAWLGFFGAWGAAGTTAIARDRLREVRGSECLTGAVVSYGLTVVAILLLWAFS